MNDIVDDVEKDAKNDDGPETKWRRARSAIRDWGESSSCHGIPHMAQASTLGLEAANFPSVTFCNTNPYKMSKIQKVPALKALLSVYETSAKGDLL
ncbi:hypothetical protein RB195_003884 [Necator americanus]|uniref:Uncharacterized protein n=1 Tax=Necator americanus TaxID=51031 RepID=A0ABR1DS41_NECAM